MKNVNHSLNIYQDQKPFCECEKEYIYIFRAIVHVTTSEILN